MPKKPSSKVTNNKIANKAAKVLKDGGLGKTSKSISGSTLSQSKGNVRNSTERPGIKPPQ